MDKIGSVLGGVGKVVEGITDVALAPLKKLKGGGHQGCQGGSDPMSQCSSAVDLGLGG